MIIKSLLHQPLCICKSFLSIIPHPFLQRNYSFRKQRDCWKSSSSTFDNTRRRRGRNRRGEGLLVCGFLPVDPWAPSTNIDSQSIASQLFSFSLFPYLGFLYFITKSKTAPKLTLFGFYFLLAFVGATIPAGIYAKVQYGTSLANVDWLHGGAESLLTLTNLFIVMGLRDALRKIEAKKEKDSNNETSINEDKNTSV